jgi:hypothetical protein
METRLLSPEEQSMCHFLKEKLMGLALLERMLAHQVSRLLWLREVDACTDGAVMMVPENLLAFVDEVKMTG